MPLFKQTSHKKADDKKINLQNPKILGVNLIKDEAIISFDWNKGASILVAVLFLAILLVGEIDWGLDWWEGQEIARVQSLNNDIGYGSLFSSE